MKLVFSFAAVFGLLSMVGASVAPVEAASGPKFGCFKVTAYSLNIRARPRSSSDVIAVASKGDFLIKRKRFCTLRGFWCAVTYGNVKGYADKKYMKKRACP